MTADVNLHALFAGVQLTLVGIFVLLLTDNVFTTAFSVALVGGGSILVAAEIGS